MAKIVLIRHAEIGTSPAGIRTGHYLKLIPLLEAIHAALDGQPFALYHCDEPGGPETAAAIAELLEISVPLHPCRALSEKASNAERDGFFRQRLAAATTIVGITHRDVVPGIYDSLARVTMQSLPTRPNFRYRLLEIFPKALLIDTDTMIVRVISANRHDN